MVVALLFPNIEVIEVGVSNFVTVDYASFSFPVFFAPTFTQKSKKLSDIIIIMVCTMMISIKLVLFLTFLACF